MALALNNLKRADMPLNKETKPTIMYLGYNTKLYITKNSRPKRSWIFGNVEYLFITIILEIILTQTSSTS